MVEQSINTVPRSAAAMMPSSRNTLRTSAPAGSMVMTKSTPPAASLTDDAGLAPDCTTKFNALRQIIDLQIMARSDQIARHKPAHVADADESHSRHDVLVFRLGTAAAESQRPFANGTVC